MWRSLCQVTVIVRARGRRDRVHLVVAVKEECPSCFRATAHALQSRERERCQHVVPDLSQQRHHHISREVASSIKVQRLKRPAHQEKTRDASQCALHRVSARAVSSSYPKCDAPRPAKSKSCVVTKIVFRTRCGRSQSLHSQPSLAKSTGWGNDAPSSRKKLNSVSAARRVRGQGCRSSYGNEHDTGCTRHIGGASMASDHHRYSYAADGHAAMKPPLAFSRVCCLREGATCYFTCPTHMTKRAL